MYNEDEQIVKTNIAYTYKILREEIEQLQNRYAFLETGNIGYSVLGKPIPYIKLGRGEKEVCYNASFHANEWITSVILMKFIEDFCKAYENNQEIYGYQARQIFSQTSIYLIPMVNPDGVDLVTGAVEENTNIYRNYEYIAKNFPAIPFPSGWKANFNGVDLKIYQPVLNFTDCDTDPFVHFPILLFLHFALV